MYLSENTPEAQAMRENVLNLVSSQDENNITLALQLMKGGGFVPETAVPLWLHAIENVKAKKEVLLFLKDSLPEQAYHYIQLYFEYDDNSLLFAMRHFEKLVQYEGFGWDNLIDHILPYAFNNTFDNHKTVISAKEYFLLHPQTNKTKVLRAMRSYETELDLQGVNIAHLPENIGDLQEITSVNLFETNISELPESFYTLQNITHFHVASTPLEKNPNFLPTLKVKSPKLWAYVMCQNIVNFSKLDEIENIYNEVLAILPDYLDAFNGLILKLSEYRKYKTIVKYAELYPALCKDDGYYDKIIANAYFEEKQYEKATKIYENIAQANTYSEYYRDLCNVYLKINKTKEAVKTAQEALAYDSTDMLNHVALMEAYVAQKDFTKALQASEKAAEEDDKHMAFLRKKAEIYIAMGKTDEAEKYYQKLLKNRDDYEETWYIKAQVHEDRGDEKNMIKCYQKIITSGYTYTQNARVALGYLYLKKKQYAKAECMFYESALRVMDNLAHEAHLGLACVYAMQHDTAFALENLQQAVQESTACKERAKTEPYLESIRQEPIFLELTR